MYNRKELHYCLHYCFLSLFLLLKLFLLNVPLISCKTTTSTLVTNDTTSFTVTTDNPTTESNLVGVDNDPCNDVNEHHYREREADGILCRSHSDCQSFSQYCCEVKNRKVCVKPPSKIYPSTHQPLLGVIPRECPGEPIPEPFAVRKCATDADCWPRICCPDGNSSYCRTPQPPWQRLPAQRIVAPIRSMMAYMQCTPPPPPLYDLFPKECRTTLDCFPNLCCQEQNRKICRPPRRSLLALISSLGRP
ncbi:uncharacterized protein LOC142325329 [Lycorma delicatula]|uniref:uncharacterized protein LOC142325329 n=1 Tax=Lycorma delicatula TaxID=130591 RepID=UPI003F50EB4D